MSLSFQCIEEFFKAYQYTISTIGTAATVGVIWLSLNQNKPKLDILLDPDYSQLKLKNGSIEYSNPYYIYFSITNRGLLPVTLYRKVICKKIFGDPKDIKFEEDKNPTLDQTITINPGDTKFFCIKEYKELNSYLAKIHHFLFPRFFTLYVMAVNGKSFNFNNTHEIIKKLKQYSK